MYLYGFVLVFAWLCVWIGVDLYMYLYGFAYGFAWVCICICMDLYWVGCSRVFGQSENAGFCQPDRTLTLVSPTQTAVMLRPSLSGKHYSIQTGSLLTRVVLYVGCIFMCFLAGVGHEVWLSVSLSFKSTQFVSGWQSANTFSGVCCLHAYVFLGWNLLS